MQNVALSKAPRRAGDVALRSQDFTRRSSVTFLPGNTLSGQADIYGPFYLTNFITL